ncbi:MAG TPA: hypothetical protein PLT55_01075 [Acidimicrobiia bacterium]|nr:hypothetical protein [Acidimicrobiia bacterium]
MVKITNRPKGDYVSRRGEHPSSVADAISSPSEGFQQRAVVLVRIAGGMTSVSRHYLSGVRDSDTVKDLQRNDYMPPKVGAQGTVVTSYDIMELTREPKWISQEGSPFVRAGTWELKLDSIDELDGPNETFLRNISHELSKGNFNKWAAPNHGGVATLPVIIIEVPGFDDEIVDRVMTHLTSEKGTEQFVELVDTRSFDKEHLLEHFRKYFPDTSKAPLERSSTVNAILDKYHGSAEMALRIVSDAKRNPMDENGLCTVPLRDLFKAAQPQFSNLLGQPHGQGLGD